MRCRRRFVRRTSQRSDQAADAAPGRDNRCCRKPAVRGRRRSARGRRRVRCVRSRRSRSAAFALGRCTRQRCSRSGREHRSRKRLSTPRRRRRVSRMSACTVRGMRAHPVTCIGMQAEAANSARSCLRHRDCRWSAVSRRRRSNWRRRRNTTPAPHRPFAGGRPTAAPSTAGIVIARNRYRAHELERIQQLRCRRSGVPSTCTSWLIGTDCGCSGRLASVCSRPARCSRDSPMPTMPPQQVFMPACAHMFQRVEAILILAGVDHLAVELRRGVEVVVVVVEAGVLQRIAPAIR